MIRRNTWILLVLLALLVGFSFYWTNRKAKLAAQVTPTTTSSAPLFSAAQGSVKELKVQDSTGKSVDLARNDNGTWVLKAPTEAPADQAAAEAAASQVTALKILGNVQLGPDVAGLDKPAYAIIVTFADGKPHTLSVGAVTPIQDGYYTSLDGGPIRIVDKPGLDALISLLSQPPYAATPIPPVSSTATLGIPTLIPGGTAVVTVTPGGAFTPTPNPVATETPAATSPAPTSPAATATP